MSYLNDLSFRAKSYAICKIIAETKEKNMNFQVFCTNFLEKYKGTISESTLLDMKHAVKVIATNPKSTIFNYMRFS